MTEETELGRLKRLFRKRPAGFDLTAPLARKQHDPCWFMAVEPQDNELEARIVNNLRRGDIRRQFALLVGGRV